MADRERLWNSVEAAEKRCGARLGRELVVALPRELNDAENLELVRGFVAGSLTGRGMVADFAVHAPTASDGLRQPHVHILTNTRAIDPESPTGFGRKVREWDKRELVTSLRQEWAEHCNRALELAQVQERVDHRSLADQLAEALAVGDFARAAEVDRLPGLHMGPKVAALERDGIATDIGNEQRAIEAVNRERGAVYEHVLEVAADVPDAPARFLEARAASTDPTEAFVTWGDWAMSALERAAELGRGAAERVLAFAEAGMTAVSDGLRDLFGRLHEADDRGLTQAREQVQAHERRAQENALERAREQLRERQARHEERQAQHERQQLRDRQRERGGLELGG